MKKETILWSVLALACLLVLECFDKTLSPFKEDWLVWTLLGAILVIMMMNTLVEKISTFVSNWTRYTGTVTFARRLAGFDQPTSSFARVGLALAAAAGITVILYSPTCALAFRVCAGGVRGLTTMREEVL
jgi:peptidoglycan/LPS O-acetylase OafA/YrhL